MKFLSHFSRITSAGRNYIPQLDGLRFIGLLAVIAYHVQKTCLHKFGAASAQTDQAPRDWFNQLLEAGSFSVLLFFTMSGFILVVPFAKQHLCGDKRQSLPAYYWRRVTRVEPPYMIHLVFLLFLSWLVLRHQPSHPALFHNDAWISNLTRHVTPSFFYSYGFVYADMPYPNKVLWSLEAEIQFYIVAPFLAMLFGISRARWRRGVLIGLILISSVIPYLFSQSVLFRFLLLGNIQFFLSGFLLADLYLAGPTAEKIQQRRSFFWDLVFLLACAGVVVVHVFPAVSFVGPWLSLLMCLGGFQGVVCSKVLGNPWVTTIGGMCYTIYMYHWLIISALVRVTGGWQTHNLPLDLFIQIVIMTPIIFLLCAVPFALFERPFMQRNWPSRWWAAIQRGKKKAEIEPVPRS